MMLDKLFKGKPKPRSAHQLATLAAVLALDLGLEDEHPTVNTGPSHWPQLSLGLKRLEAEDVTEEMRGCFDREQVYFRTFVIWSCLESVPTANAGVAKALFEAWDYYLRNLPQSHGVTFDYSTWSERRTQYVQAWDEAAARRAENPDMMKNVFWPIAKCFAEDVCGLVPATLITIDLTIIASATTDSFIQTTQKWIVNRE